jgi:putative holliday junction resolvase
MKILAVDPGSKRIGLALSDPTSTLAHPLMVITHLNRLRDAGEVVEQANRNKVELILVGQSLDENGMPTYEGRRSMRFAETLQTLTSLPVILWDESLTTRDAKEASLRMGMGRKKRKGHMDSLAAAVLLQSYLDSSMIK